MSKVKAINVQEATIRTATVEVKTLTISGRQVTLSVFRQLPVKPIFGFYPTVGLLGQAWGRVHYFPAPCYKSCRGHLHVVWVGDGELRRACVDPLEFHSGEFARYAAGLGEDQVFYRGQRDRLNAAALVAEWLSRPNEVQVAKKEGGYSGEYIVTFPSGLKWGVPVWRTSAHGVFHEMASDLLSHAVGTGGAEYRNPDAVRAAYRKAISDPKVIQWEYLDADVGEEDTTNPDSLRVLARGCEAKAAAVDPRLAEARKRYRTLYAELQALPQLFIAV